MPPKSKQEARRAAANDGSKCGGVEEEFRCSCCGANGCSETARSGIEDLRARFGHAIQMVADPGSDEAAFMYTVGADPEFLVEGVPKEHVQEMAKTLNFLVDRVNSGHPVRHGHTISSGRFLLVAIQLQGAELGEALAYKCTACSHDSAVVRLEPLKCQDCNAVELGAASAPFSGEGHRLGDP